MYSNLRGCDGERVYYQGGSLIGINGNIVTRGESFSLKDVVGCFEEEEEQKSVPLRKTQKIKPLQLVVLVTHIIFFFLFFSLSIFNNLFVHH